jgi:hypothetical protein
LNKNCDLRSCSNCSSDSQRRRPTGYFWRKFANNSSSPLREDQTRPARSGRIREQATKLIEHVRRSPPIPTSVKIVTVHSTFTNSIHLETNEIEFPRKITSPKKGLKLTRKSTFSQSTFFYFNFDFVQPEVFPCLSNAQYMAQQICFTLVENSIFFFNPATTEPSRTREPQISLGSQARLVENSSATHYFDSSNDFRLRWLIPRY